MEKSSLTAQESFVLQLVLPKCSHYYVLGHSNSGSFIAFLFFFLGVSCDFSFSDAWNSALVAQVSQVTAKPQEGATGRADTAISSSLPPVIESYIYCPLWRSFSQSIVWTSRSTGAELTVCWFSEKMVRDDLGMFLLILLSCHLP